MKNSTLKSVIRFKMRNNFYGLITIAIVAGTILTNCNASTQKGPGMPDMQAAPEQKRTQEVSPADYLAFKKTAVAKIDSNEIRIAELRAQLAKEKKSPLNDVQRQKIDTLEARNDNLRDRLYGYETAHIDWTIFKNNFKRDMDDLNVIFHDFWQHSKMNKGFS